jgi:N-acetylneuraminic acid mutarotase
MFKATTIFGLLLGGLLLSGGNASAQFGTWTTDTSMPTPRENLAVSMVNGILYAVGGSHNGARNTVEAYDPTSNTWLSSEQGQLQPMSTPRNGVSVGVLSGILYAVGGDTDGGATGYLASVEAYDPTIGAWSPRAPMSTPRDDVAVGVIDGILYAAGGLFPNGVALSTLEAYDPKADTWTIKAAMPTPRLAAGAGVVNGLLYVVGGQNATTAFSTVEAYDPKNNTWSTKAPMPTARLGPAVAVVNGILYAMGGIGGGCPTPCSVVEAYDPTKDTWSTVAPMPTPRYLLAAGVVSGRIFAVGGANASGDLPTVEAISPSKCATGPCIESPDDGASQESNFVALSGTGTAGHTLEVLVNGSSVGSVAIDSEGYWEALPDAAFYGGGGPAPSPTLQVQDETTLALSNIITVHPQTTLPLPPIPPLKLLPLRHADIFVAALPSSPQTPLYGPAYTHAALYLGGDANGTPMLAEAVTASEAGANGQVRALPLEQSLVWTAQRLTGWTPKNSPLSSTERDGIVGWAADITNQGLPYWSLTTDIGIPITGAWLLFSNTCGLVTPRFNSFINLLNTSKNSVSKFICGTLVWRAYFEGTAHTLDISNPNNITATPGSTLGNLPVFSPVPAFCPVSPQTVLDEFLDQLSTVLVLPETFATSPKLKQIF